MMMMDPAEALLRSRCKEKKQLITLKQVTTRWPALGQLDGSSCFQLIFNKLCLYAHFHDQRKWISIN